MSGRTLATLLAVSLVALALPSPATPHRAAGDRPTGVGEDTAAVVLRRRLAAPGTAELLSPALVKRFYERRGYAPIWTDGAAVGVQAAGLVRAIQAAGTEGLHPRDYRLARIVEVIGHLSAVPRGHPLEPGERATLDLLMTDAVLTYGSHLAHGRIAPERIHSGWSLPPREVDVVAALERAVQSGRVEAALVELAPSTPEYVALRRALRRYQEIEARGGWPHLPAGPTLRPDDRGPAVAALRARLAAEVVLARSDSPTVYDPALAEAVREFQRTHGLRDDAAVGPATRAALIAGAGSRAEQITLSLERLRWLPDDLGQRHVRVNIPAFELEAVDGGRPALAMRVVGGRPDWRTPVFSARMTSVALSPYWNIPQSIAAEEVLPRARRDPDYLRRNAIRRVPDGSGGYRLRQDPGPLNPLGGVKFLFPNPYNVYLHDTPSKHLFAEPQRAYSHGCMRVEKPLDLAEYVLGPLGWNRAEIAREMARGVERTVRLTDPIPVHVLYRTAWVDATERVNFLDDLYGHDRRLAAALERTAAPPVPIR